MKTIFFDIDTQLDFLYPAGALYVPGAERVVPAIARLNRYAAAHGIPVISTTDAHTEDDPEFRTWPPTAWPAPRASTRPKPRCWRNASWFPTANAIWRSTARSRSSSRSSTSTSSPRRISRRVVELLAADRFVVYGVVTEICVLFAARGLLKYGKPMTIVTDAIAALTDEAQRARWQKFLPAAARSPLTSDICTDHEIHPSHAARAARSSATSPKARRPCRAAAKC